MGEARLASTLFAQCPPCHDLSHSLHSYRPQSETPPVSHRSLSRLWMSFPCRHPSPLSQSTHVWTEPYKAVATHKIRRYNTMGDRGGVDGLRQRAPFHCAEAARLLRGKATNPRVCPSRARRHRLQWVPCGRVAPYGNICSPNRDHTLPVERQRRNRGPPNRGQTQE
jgi:hypothetical protein